MTETQLVYYYNGNILTMNHSVPRSPHMLVSGEHIWHCDPSHAPLGLDFRSSEFHETRDRLSGDVRFVDLNGKTVIPGICDAHAHFIMWGQFLAEIDVASARSEDECVAILTKNARPSSSDDWIIGRGWAHNLWTNPALPSKEALDKAFPDNPVFLTSKCCHVAWVNSKALAIAGLSNDTPDPEGGEIERRNGEATGILKENAIGIVSEQFGDVTEDRLYDAMNRAQATAQAQGITAMQTPEDMDTWEFLQKAHSRGLLSMRINFWIPVDALDDFIATRTGHGLGDQRLRISAVKIFTDGSLGGRTALMYDDYENEPGNRGIVVTSQNEITRRTLQANRAGLSMAIHAIGDLAVGYVLTAYEQAAAELGTDGDTRTNPVLRNRIEHTQIIAEKDIPRFRALKPIASMQPIHMCADMGPADRHWGDRSRYAYACRTLADAGCLLAFGSDIPVEPCNPFHGMYAAVTRNNLAGKPGDGWQPQEKISLQQTLEAYTINCATAAGVQDVLGSLETGKLADFVILPEDPFEITAENLRDMQPLATFSGGKCVYRSDKWEKASS